MGARPSRIVGQGYSPAGTFWCVLNVSLRASGTQVRFDIVDQLWKQFGWYRGALLCIRVYRFVMCGMWIGMLCLGAFITNYIRGKAFCITFHLPQLTSFDPKNVT